MPQTCPAAAISPTGLHPYPCALPSTPFGQKLSIKSGFLRLSPEHGERNPPARRFVRLSAGRCRNDLVHRTIRNAIERVGDPRKFIDDLVGNRRPLQHDRTPPAELLHRPGCRRNDEDDNRQQFFTTCDGDGSAKEMKNMIREQMFLPAGAKMDNYSIGCLFARHRQWKSRNLDEALSPETCSSDDPPASVGSARANNLTLASLCAPYSVQIHYTRDSELPAQGAEALR